MGELDTQQLDALASTMGKLKFYPTGSSVDVVVFDVNRKDHSLVFKHKNLSVTVGDFKLVDWDSWLDKQYPAVDNRIIQYLYRADVNAQVDNTKVQGVITLGYWRDRHKLLEPLARGIERETIDSLLLNIDKVCMNIFPFEA